MDETRLNWLAIVDTRSKKRIGTASNWLSHAPHVLILDHHTAPDPFEIRPSDVGGRLQIIGDHVGAVTTVIVERIMLRPDIILSRAECTLLALAIHADTGSLTFDSTTPRDAAALAWLLAKGACQRSVSQFARAYLTTPQQHLLANALDCMVVQNVAGTRLAHVVLESEEFVKGMAGVAQAALELSNIDALVLAVVAPAGRGRRGIDSTKQVSIIGRARSTVECVNFAPLLSPLGGGGHAHAASASVKVRGGEEVGRLVETVLEGVMNQLPPPVLAEACMSTGVVGVTADQTMREARDLLYESGHTGVIVTKNEGDEKLIGIISRQDVALAERRGKLETPVKGWVARKVIFVKPTTALHEIEALLVDNNIGRVPVVDDGKVIGIVTRSNVLMQRRLCSPLEEEG